MVKTTSRVSEDREWRRTQQGQHMHDSRTNRSESKGTDSAMDINNAKAENPSNNVPNSKIFQEEMSYDTRTEQEQHQQNRGIDGVHSESVYETSDGNCHGSHKQQRVGQTTSRTVLADSREDEQTIDVRQHIEGNFFTCEMEDHRTTNEANHLIAQRVCQTYNNLYRTTVVDRSERLATAYELLIFPTDQRYRWRYEPCSYVPDNGTCTCNCKA